VRAWRNHAALNAGLAVWHLRQIVDCIFFGALPPNWTGHSASDMADLQDGSARDWFLRGLSEE
jgi:hypothetical protein